MKVKKPMPSVIRNLAMAMVETCRLRAMDGISIHVTPNNIVYASWVRHGDAQTSYADSAELDEMMGRKRRQFQEVKKLG